MDGCRWSARRLWPGVMLGALDSEVRHFALDDAREGAQAWIFHRGDGLVP